MEESPAVAQEEQEVASAAAQSARRQLEESAASAAPAATAAKPSTKIRKSRADPAKAAAKAAAIAAAAVVAAEAAVEAARAEGLTLVRSHGSACGYKNVIHNKKPNSTKPWLCTVREPGSAGTKKTKLGLFSTKEEAALRYARYVGRAATEEMDALYLKTMPMTPEAVAEAAATEGLTLQRAPGTAEPEPEPLTLTLTRTRTRTRTLTLTLPLTLTLKPSHCDARQARPRAGSTCRRTARRATG